MSIYGWAKAGRTSRRIGPVGAALAFSLASALLGAPTAHAQELRSGGCIGPWNAFNCVTRWGPATDPFIRVVPPPPPGPERDRAIELDRRWVDRCRPEIWQDRYGVGRYRYARPGCEFGIGEY